MDRKWLMVLPNLFTVSSIFCGLAAIVWCSGAPGGVSADLLHRSALAILGGMFCDGFDGRVARLTHTESEFGVQLDSLADVITFGVAPAVLLYQWALWPLGGWGLALAGLYTSCGALRLARFNVLAQSSEGPASHFVGLPIPLAAGMVVAVVLAAAGAPVPVIPAPAPVAVLAVVLAWLMVSTIRYPSFKKARPNGRFWLSVLALLAVGALVAVQLGARWVLLSYSTVYLALGLVTELLRRLPRSDEPSHEHPSHDDPSPVGGLDK